jgi:pimeloyl-ACP methyl ester carboxylesterase
MASKTLPFPPLPLPEGITESYVPTADLTYHILSSGKISPTHPSNPTPLILLIHGFPELAFSWRDVMVPLSLAGYHVVAYDQRGYGRTTGWDDRSFHDTDLRTFTFSRLVADALRLVSALGYAEVACVVGHDFGAVTAGMCGLMRSDVFKRYEKAIFFMLADFYTQAVKQIHHTQSRII